MGRKPVHLVFVEEKDIKIVSEIIEVIAQHSG